MPVVFAPHGGGPWPFVEMGLDKKELGALADYLRELRKVPKAPPKALLIVSAHWEAKVPTVMTNAHPPILYDYYGFPPESYAITWPAPGDPALASRVRGLLEKAGFATGEDGDRGFDHGAFIPFKLTYPEAEVPAIQLSLKAGLDPKEHLAMGRALAPLRDEGVFILASGMTFHNMRAFRNPQAMGVSQEFDDWLKDTVAKPGAERERLLASWADAPAARICHPREEHLIPLMVAAGAAGDDPGVTAYNASFMGVKLSAFHFGVA